MLMTRSLLRSMLLIIFACGFIVIAIAMPAMSTVTAVAEHMHRDHPDAEQHPNPVLRKPFHDLLLCQITMPVVISPIDIVSSQRHVNESITPVCRKDLVDADGPMFKLQRASGHI